jgi:hypothetical protein
MMNDANELNILSQLKSPILLSCPRQNVYRHGVFNLLTADRIPIEFGMVNKYSMTHTAIEKFPSLMNLNLEIEH